MCFYESIVNIYFVYKKFRIVCNILKICIIFVYIMLISVVLGFYFFFVRKVNFVCYLKFLI